MSPSCAGSLHALVAAARIRRWLLLPCLLIAPAFNATADAWAAAPDGPQVVREEIGRRTEMSRTFLLDNGSHRTEVATAPMNYQDSQRDWHAIDTTLRPDGAGGLQTTSSPSDVALPHSLDNPVEVRDAAGRSLSFALSGADASSTESANGSRAVYSNVRPGVDVGYETLAGGLKETLTLADTSAPSTYAFTLSHSEGLTALLRENGSAVVKDASGKIRFTLPAPTVQQRGEAQPSTAHVRYALSDDHATLHVVVDPAWLAAADFPVKVDPTVYIGAPTGCTLASGSLAGTADCGASSMRIGYDGTRVQRTAVRIGNLPDLGIPRSAQITYTAFGAWMSAMGSATTPARLDAFGSSKQISSGATWNSYDGVNSWTTPGGDVSATSPTVTSINAQPADVGGWVNFDITALAQSWIRDPSANNGLIIRAHDETANNLVTFNGPGSSANGPNMRIDWRQGTGSEQDKNYESVGIDDRSGASVNVASGNLAVTTSDVHLAGVNGLDLDVSRTYNAEDLGDGHPFGSAWTESINGASVRMDYSYLSGSRVLYANGGAVYRFENTNTAPPSQSAPTFATPPGINATMTTNANDSGVTVTFNDSGLKWVFGSPIDGFTERLVQIKDTHGNHIDLSYGSDSSPNSLSSITDTYGNVITVNRNTSGDVTGMTDAQSRHWSFGLTGTHSLLTSATNPDTKVTGYGYDASNPNVWDKLTTLTDARGHDFKFEYDPTAVTGDNSQVTKITRVVDGTTTNDVSWTFNYKPTAGTGHSCSDTTNGRTVETDPRGKLTTYCYNPSGQTVETWDALGRKQSREYNAQANVVNASDAAGGTGNPMHVDFASDSTHNPTGGREPSGETFGFTYCTTPSTTTNSCSGGVTGDLANFKLQGSTDEQGSTTNYDYNATGDLKRVNDAQSPTVASLNLDYNTSGTVTDGTMKTSTDANGNTTTYGYTNHNLTSITPPSSSTLIGATTLTYDTENRVRTATDGLGTTATVDYDGEDRVTKVAYSNGRSFVMTYDADGNSTQRTESLSGSVVNTTTYGYDNLNRRTSEAFPGSVSNAYEYDKAGNLTGVTDTGGKTTYAYDDINRLASVTSPKTGTANCTTSPTSCDSLTYAYADLAGTAASNGATRRQTVTMPGANLTQVIEANASGRLTSTAVKNNAGTVLQGQSLAYAVGASQKALVQSIVNQPANTTTSYSYGTGAGSGADIGALLEAQTKNGSGSVIDDWVYTTDVAGNRTKRTHTASGTTSVTSYAYNAANQMCWSLPATSTNACGTVPTGATTYTYDHAGNQTTGQGYDALSRMTSTGSTTLGYLTPTNNELTSVGTTGLQNGLLGLIRQVPSSGSATAYTRQPDGTPVAQRSSTTKQYLFGDHLGSITALAANGANTLASTYSYDPDGQRTLASGSTTSDLGFVGGYTVTGGLIHFGARFYNPALARWTQTDPLNQTTSLQEANRYGYVGGNPINATDPDGRIGLKLTLRGQRVAFGRVGFNEGDRIVGGTIGVGNGSQTSSISAGLDRAGPHEYPHLQVDTRLFGEKLPSLRIPIPSLPF